MTSPDWGRDAARDPETPGESRPRVVVWGVGNQQQWIEPLRTTIAAHAEIVSEEYGPLEELPCWSTVAEADFAIVLGGDGSILRAAYRMGEFQLPVLGVNLGKLGFLAAIPPEELAEMLPQVCQGRCRVIDHLMFQCEVTRDGELLARRQGLNEVAILGGPPFSILTMDLYIDAELATTYSCDGLIVATPVGSTAHSLSAGGPILRKSLQAFVISPISPHTLTVRPVVDDASRVLEIQVRQPNQATSVVVDGRLVTQLTENDRVRVARAAASFRMIEVGQHGYYRTLREKLGWGGYFPASQRSAAAPPAADE